MPFYLFRCDTCGQLAEAVRTVARRDDAPSCDCGAVMSRRFTAPQIVSIEIGEDQLNNVTVEAAGNREKLASGEYQPISRDQLVNMKPFGAAKLRSEGSLIGTLASG